MDKTMLRLVLWEFLRPLITLITNLINPEIGEEWLTELNKFNRKDPCWVTVTKKVVEEPKACFRRLFEFTLGFTNGSGTTYATAGKVFQGYFDPNFKKCVIVFSGTIPKTKVAVDELIQYGKFSDFLGTTASELEKRRLFGSQFLAICRDYPNKLREGGFANFFVLTKNDEKVAEDLSNVFVADARMYGIHNLCAYLYVFRDISVWQGDAGLRVFSPQQ